MPEDYKEILDRLISFPLRSQIKIDFDLKDKSFLLSVPIFTGRTTLPVSVRAYVEARKNHFFKPHKTSFQISGEKRVVLAQRIAFLGNFEQGLRDPVIAFWKLAKHCHRLLVELAIEEKYETALYLDLD